LKWDDVVTERVSGFEVVVWHGARSGSVNAAFQSSGCAEAFLRSAAFRLPGVAKRWCVHWTEGFLQVQASASLEWLLRVTDPRSGGSAVSTLLDLANVKVVRQSE